MKKVIYYNDLYDLYKDFLTEKEQEIFKDYYAEDYSLQEIADIKKISRNAVFKMIKRVEKKLENFETILKLNNKILIIKEILSKCDDEDVKKKIAKALEIEL